MRFQHSALLIFSSVPQPLFFHRLGTPKEPSKPRGLAFNTFTVVLGGRRAFIFFRLVPTIKLLKLFSTLQESYLMMILFLPFKLILFQYGTFAVIIILLLRVIPSIMTENVIAWGKGLILVFLWVQVFFCLILSTAIISEDKPIYSLKSFLSIPC